ncbi:hypothetical protein [Bdellovibrio sp. HCB274]|uniref:hypothetical protein n=1 Tax=Bdellovibrio sp. HCB274 TaxID=3394361 RepID=UPI0039B3D891
MMKSSGRILFWVLLVAGIWRIASQFVLPRVETRRVAVGPFAHAFIGDGHFQKIHCEVQTPRGLEVVSLENINNERSMLLSEITMRSYWAAVEGFVLPPERQRILKRMFCDENVATKLNLPDGIQKVSLWREARSLFPERLEQIEIQCL